MTAILLIARDFNNYFINLGRTLARELESDVNYPLIYIDSNINSIVIYL